MADTASFTFTNARNLYASLSFARNLSLKENTKMVLYSISCREGCHKTQVSKKTFGSNCVILPDIHCVWECVFISTICSQVTKILILVGGLSIAERTQLSLYCALKIMMKLMFESLSHHCYTLPKFAFAFAVQLNHSCLTSFATLLVWRRNFGWRQVFSFA